RGRVRAVLYRRADWKVLASEDDVALARYAPGSDALLFSRSSKPGLWRADARLGGIVRIADDRPTPPFYRHWALLDGRPYSLVPEADCPAPWRALLAADRACLSRSRPCSAARPRWTRRRDGCTWACRSRRTSTSAGPGCRCRGARRLRARARRRQPRPTSRAAPSDHDFRMPHAAISARFRPGFLSFGAVRDKHPAGFRTRRQPCRCTRSGATAAPCTKRAA